MTVINAAHPVALGVGGLEGLGPGIAGFTTWIVAAGVILLLAALAWWTTRPAKRVGGRLSSRSPEPRRSDRRDRHPS